MKGWVNSAFLFRKQFELKSPEIPLLSGFDQGCWDTPGIVEGFAIEHVFHRTPCLFPQSGLSDK